MNLKLPVVQPRPDSHLAFEDVLAEHGLSPLRREATTTLQVNVGKLCNQACSHCHVEAGPKRTEIMGAEVAARVVELIETSPALALVDITGGAPELNPHFRALVRAARQRELEVIDRCNLTVLFEPGMEDLPAFLAEQRVQVTASLPCYSLANVDKQRGTGVFEKSIEALRLLNELGFGIEGSGLLLDLVYNPGGAFLPPAQEALEARYKDELRAGFDVAFNRLLTITNMPISRFAHQLERDGAYAGYMQLLLESFNPSTVDGLMCRSLLSVGWDGALYDCDFNQMLEIELGGRLRAPSIFDLESLEALTGRAIGVGSHCLGCTAGSGSSCGGTIS